MQSKYFIIQEYMPRSTFTKFQQNSVWFIDQRLVDADDFIREWFGVQVTINNWWWGGVYNESGFRTNSSQTGATLSQHRHGRASDKKFKGIKPKQVFDEIMKYEKVFFDAGVRAIEDVRFTPTWLHTDVRNTGLIDQILIVKP